MCPHLFSYTGACMTDAIGCWGRRRKLYVKMLPFPMNKNVSFSGRKLRRERNDENLTVVVMRQQRYKLFTGYDDFRDDNHNRQLIAGCPFLRQLILGRPFLMQGHPFGRLLRVPCLEYLPRSLLLSTSPGYLPLSTSSKIFPV